MSRLLAGFRSFALFPLLLLAYPAPGGAGVGLGLGLPRVEVTLSPGDSWSSAIPVQNRGTERARILTTVMDLTMDVEGRLDIVKAGSTSRSASSWIRVNPTVFELEPEETKLIRFTVTAPRGVSGTYLAVILFRTRPEKLKGMGAALSAEIGSTLIVHVSGQGLKRAGDLVDLTVSPPRPGEPLQVVALFANEGNVLLRPKGMLTILDDRGNVIGQAPINEEEGAVLPLSRRAFRTLWRGDLPPGTYHLEVRFDYGGEAFVVGETTVKVATP